MAWSPGTPSWVSAALNRKPQTLPMVRLGVRAPPHRTHAEDDGDGEQEAAGAPDGQGGRQGPPHRTHAEDDGDGEDFQE